MDKFIKGITQGIEPFEVPLPHEIDQLHEKNERLPKEVIAIIFAISSIVAVFCFLALIYICVRYKTYNDYSADLLNVEPDHVHNMVVAGPEIEKFRSKSAHFFAKNGIFDPKLRPQN